MAINPAHLAPPGTDSKPQFDTSVPHPARVYGYWLYGKDHYAADREAVPTIAYLEQQAGR